MLIKVGQVWQFEQVFPDESCWLLIKKIDPEATSIVYARLDEDGNEDLEDTYIKLKSFVEFMKILKAEIIFTE